VTDVEHFDTGTLNLGRRTPRTPAQRAEALSGIAQCNRDWHAGELTTSGDMTRLGWSACRRAGYELRWIEHAATLPNPRRYPVRVSA
jgi:hypothetical protein